MIVDIEEKDVARSILGLVVALVEVIKDALQVQAFRRMEAGSLTEAEVEKLGQALISLDAAIERIKLEAGVAEAVKAIRDGLDSAVDDAIGSLLSPGAWVRASQVQ